jgi:hypothetical protein
MKRWCIALLVLSGCADTQFFGDGSTPAGDGPALDTRRLTDLPPPGEEVIYTGEPVVYAHSSDKLYKVDPGTLQVTLIAPFKWPGFLPDEMTDIALDRKGKMVGISYTVVYSVDPKTAACTRLADLDSTGFNGLSYVASEIADGKELLMATASTGLVYEIDPTTGKSKQIGNYGGPGSSGDVVSVKGLGTFATVKQYAGFSTGTDWLAKIDVLTGKATLIGDTGVVDIWGLGFWKNKFYGFTEGSQFILVDPKTGKATTVSSGGGPWWGAGVTTVAPVIE